MRYTFSRIALLVVCTLGFLPLCFAQQPSIAQGSLGYYNDAYLLSNQSVFGTSRFMGIGGARTALGGDIGTIAANPAGLGFFNKSEFSLTAGIGFLNANSTFLDETTRSGIGNFNIPHIGVVLNYTKDDIVPNKWRGFNVGISLNRMANFQQQFEYEGVNRNSSIIDFYLESARQYDPQVLIDEVNNNAILSSDVLGFATYLVDYNSPWLLFDQNDTLPRYGSWIPITDMRQYEKVRRRGAINQIDIALGGNYDDRLYIGGSIGIQSIRYSEVRTYRETTIQPSDPALRSPLNSLEARDELNMSGVGINFKGGLIYRPIDYVRFGVTYQSPTWVSMNSNFISTLEARYDGSTYWFPDANNNTFNLNTISASTLRGEFNYGVTAPQRVNVGTAIFFKKFGFLSADVEMVSYNQALLRSLDANLNADNRTIATLFQPVVNYRIGAELREDIFRFRAGYAFQPSGIRSVDGINRDITTISCGGGIRKNDYYIDLAIVNQRFAGGYSPYTLANGTHPNVKSAFRNTLVTITYGTFF
jgi:long-subunit fatty acid transport protein